MHGERCDACCAKLRPDGGEPLRHVGRGDTHRAFCGPACLRRYLDMPDQRGLDGRTRLELDHLLCVPLCRRVAELLGERGIAAKSTERGHIWVDYRAAHYFVAREARSRQTPEAIADEIERITLEDAAQQAVWMFVRALFPSEAAA